MKWSNHIIQINLEHVQFVDNELMSNWYNGNETVHMLLIKTNQLYAIHANAFNCSALRELLNLEIHIAQGTINIHDGTLNGMRYITSLRLVAKSVGNLPINLFDPIAGTMKFIEFEIWPNNVNLIDSFARETYRMLEGLVIENVQMPQSKFQYLSANDFKTFRRLRFLELINCGIEVIDAHTFDYIGRLLIKLILNLNRIKAINVDMFRKIYESKYNAQLVIKSNAPLMCSCQVIDVNLMLYPLISMPFIDCTADDEFDMAKTCGTYQLLRPKKICVRMQRKSELFKYINIRMAYIRMRHRL